MVSCETVSPVSTSNVPEPALKKTLWPSARVRWLIWIVYVVAWTLSLERPYPRLVLEQKAIDEWYVHYFGKAVHVSAFACFAILSAWLHVPGRYRWLLVLFMSLHAIGSE